MTMSEGGPEPAASLGEPKRHPEPGDQAFGVPVRRKWIVAPVADAVRRAPGGRRALALFRRLRKELVAVFWVVRDRVGTRSHAREGTHLAQSVTTGRLRHGQPVVANSAVIQPWDDVIAAAVDAPPEAAAYFGRGTRPEFGLSAIPLLHAEGLAPRPYDFVSFGDGNAALVADAVGAPVGGQARAATSARLRALIEAGEIRSAVGAHWDEDDLYRSSGSGDCAYIGWDRLLTDRRDTTMNRLLTPTVRSDLHYGTELAVRGGRFLYQSVPASGASGRRDTGRRWDLLRDMLASAATPVSGRVVLDVGCNAGMMLAESLRDGARWAFGWDRPTVARHVPPLLFGLGFTRFDVFGRDMGPDYDLAADLPARYVGALEGSIVFYLAIRHHLGFLPSLGKIPWATMLYEGGETESVDTLDKTLMQLRRLCDFEVAAAIDFRDGETAPRPVALLLRRG